MLDATQEYVVLSCTNEALKKTSVSLSPLACEQAPGGASAEQTFGAKFRRFTPNVSSALAPPGACSQASHP